MRLFFKEVCHGKKKKSLNKKRLLSLFDYNFFSPNKNLEALAEETLAPIKSEALNMTSLDMLSAAGSVNRDDIHLSKSKKKQGLNGN